MIGQPLLNAAQINPAQVFVNQQFPQAPVNMLTEAQIRRQTKLKEDEEIFAKSLANFEESVK